MAKNLIDCMKAVVDSGMEITATETKMILLAANGKYVINDDNDEIEFKKFGEAYNYFMKCRLLELQKKSEIDDEYEF